MAKRRGTLHPVVRAFCSSETQLIDILSAQPEPREPMVEAMMVMREHLSGRASAGEALRAAAAVATEKTDPNLTVLFLGMWLYLCVQERRTDEAAALLKRQRTLISADTPAEVRVMADMNRADAVRQSGDCQLGDRISEEAIETLSPRSPRHSIFLSGALQRYAATGLLGRPDRMKALDRISATGKRGGIRSSARRAMSLLIHAVEMGRPDDAASMQKALEADPEYFAVYAGRIRSCQTLLECIGGTTPSGDPSLPPTIAPLARLLAGRRDEALTAARTAAAGDPGLSSQSLASFNLIRAELACRNGEAARRLLSKRRELGNVHPYMDDFLLARIEILAGNREQAARHYAAAVQAVEEYRARSRLDLELRLSLELSAADAVWLEQQAQQLPHEAGKRVHSPPMQPAPEPRGTQRLVGISRAMESVRQLTTRFAEAEVPVLITGETGTGKELVARALHETGPTAPHPFVAINCGAITDSLLETELFGHARGAFTGAVAAHQGIFEAAGQGTVFLDEIGEISPRLQVSLLRVLETGEVRPVGSTAARKVRCRMVAATNADLSGLAESGTFRKDLYYRLKRLEIRLPPLRERPEDILPLAEHFLADGRTDGQQPVFSPALRALLLVRQWSGNVREFRNLVEQLRLLNSDKLVYDVADLAAISPEEPVAQGQPVLSTPQEPAAAELSKLNPKAAFRRLDQLREVFRRHGKLNRREAASLLGISHVTATRDLQALCREGLVEKVEPTASPRTHYFRLRSASP